MARIKRPVGAPNPRSWKETKVSTYPGGGVGSAPLGGTIHSGCGSPERGRSKPSATRASRSSAVTVEKAGGVYTLRNATLQAQTATITVIAEYDKAGSSFNGRTYVATVPVTVAADAESPMSAAASDGQITVTHDERLSQLGAVTYEYVVSDADKPYIEIGKNGAYTVKPGDTDKTVTVTVNVLVGGSQHGAALSVTIDV